MSLLELPRPAAAIPGPAAGAAARERAILDGALRCFARWGVAKTTCDDVAREAGTSRATVYRFFPGGRDALMHAVATTEVAAFTTAVVAAAEAAAETAGDLEEVVVAGMATAAQLFTTHPALQFVLRHEPEVVLPRLAFAHLDEVLHHAGEVARPVLSRFLHGDDEAARRVGEWAARIVLSYASSPSPGIDIADPATIRTLVRTFVLPGTFFEGAP